MSLNAPRSVTPAECVTIATAVLQPGHVIEVDGKQFIVHQILPVNKDTFVLGTYVTTNPVEAVYRVSVGEFINACKFDDIAFILVR